MSTDQAVSQPRPPVSVLLPFLGDARDAAEALDALSVIERISGDELIVADNSPTQVLAGIAAGWPDVRVTAAVDEQSAYYARNAAAAAARNEWLLFTDADCTPTPSILERYFDQPIGDEVGAIAGEVDGERGQTELIARYQRDRGYLNQRRYVQSARPYAVTANLLVRTQAWRSVGGFLEGVLCDADTDFAWRLQAAGWSLGYRPEASVSHRYRETLPAFARMVVSYAAGRAWLKRRYPDAYPERANPAAIPRALGAALRWSVAGELERGRFRAIDALVIVLDRLGLARGNSARSARTARRAPASLVVIADAFPAKDEATVATELGESVAVEAHHRPVRQDLAAARSHDISYWEDDTPAQRLRALARVAVRHPGRVLADLVQRPGDSLPLRVLAPAAERLMVGEGRRIAAVGGDAVEAERLARLTGVDLQR